MEYGNHDRIVVLGGSFNPPTIAHLKLMQTALDAVTASRGILMPTPFWYVERKLKKTGNKQETLPDELRLEMLESLCSRDGRLSVDDSEMHRKERGFTYESLELIQEKNPGSEVYFLAGSDKLHIIPRWHRIREFAARFRILVAKRSGENPEDVIAETPFLAAHKDVFVIFPVAYELDQISSSAFREKLRRGDISAKEMVTEEVWELMRKAERKNEHKKECENDREKSACIDRFRDEYDFLSNFYPVQIEYGGLIYQNAEAAFQAQKCLTDEEKAAFCGLPANKAKRLGRQVQLRSDWETVKEGIMEEIVRAKFGQNPVLADKLLATGDTLLIEGNTWGDKFWGVDTRVGQGENHLGKILMKVRAENGREVK